MKIYPSDQAHTAPISCHLLVNAQHAATENKAGNTVIIANNFVRFKAIKTLLFIQLGKLKTAPIVKIIKISKISFT